MMAAIRDLLEDARRDGRIGAAFGRPWTDLMTAGRRLRRGRVLTGLAATLAAPWHLLTAFRVFNSRGPLLLLAGCPLVAVGHHDTVVLPSPSRSPGLSTPDTISAQARAAPTISRGQEDQFNALSLLVNVHVPGMTVAPVWRCSLPRGHPRRPGQTPHEYATEVSERLPRAREALGGMTETFVAVRYGGRPADSSHVARMQALAGALRKALRRPPRSRA